MNVVARRPSKLPAELILIAIAAAAAIGLGLWLYYSGQPQPEEIGAILEPAKPIPALAAAAQEKTWLAPHFNPEEGYVAVPPGPPPCPWGVDGVDPERAAGVTRAISYGTAGIPQLQELHKKNGGWLSGLPLGRLLVQQGRLAEADGLYTKMLARGLPGSNRDVIEQALAAALAARKGESRTPPVTVELIPRIYLLQASGYVQIRENKTGDELWWALKAPIACGKMIIVQERGMLVDKVIDGYELDMAPPGCPDGSLGLSSYDLYNNLIVGYLLAEGFQKPEADRKQEFERAYEDPPDQNPLLAVLRQQETELAAHPETERRVWAVSNAERLLRDRLREERGYPQHARLAATVAGLIEWTMEGAVPYEAVPALMRQQHDLLDVARARRSEIPKGEKPGFERALARLALIAASREGRQAELGDLTASFSREQQADAALVITAQSSRQDPAAWARLVLGEIDPGLATKLGKRATPWRSALRSDLAAALARLGADQEGEYRQRLALMAVSVLGSEADPPELAHLKAELGLFQRSELWLRTLTGAAVAAGIVLLAGFFIARWLALQLRLRREIFTSFYRLEAEQRLRSSR